jgi:hypothetical protein
MNLFRTRLVHQLAVVAAVYGFSALALALGG